MDHTVFFCTVHPSVYPYLSLPSQSEAGPHLQTPEDGRLNWQNKQYTQHHYVKDITVVDCSDHYALLPALGKWPVAASLRAGASVAECGKSLSEWLVASA